MKIQTRQRRRFFFYFFSFFASKALSASDKELFIWTGVPGSGKTFSSRLIETKYPCKFYHFGSYLIQGASRRLRQELSQEQQLILATDAARRIRDDCNRSDAVRCYVDMHPLLRGVKGATYVGASGERYVEGLSDEVLRVLKPVGAYFLAPVPEQIALWRKQDRDENGRVRDNDSVDLIATHQLDSWLYVRHKIPTSVWMSIEPNVKSNF